VAGEVVEVVTGVQVPTVQQDARRSFPFCGGELGGELRVATSGVGEDRDETLAQVDIHIVKHVPGGVRVVDCLGDGEGSAVTHRAES
jgi:hypothetical protein